MLKPDHKVVIAYTTTNVIGVTTVNVKYPIITNLEMIYFIKYSVVPLFFYFYYKEISQRTILQFVPLINLLFAK